MQPAGTSQHCPARNVSGIVARDGDLATEHEEPGVEVVAMVGFFHVRPQAGVTDRKPSRRSSASNSVWSIASTPLLG